VHSFFDTQTQFPYNPSKEKTSVSVHLWWN